MEIKTSWEICKEGFENNIPSNTKWVNYEELLKLVEYYTNPIGDIFKEGFLDDLHKQSPSNNSKKNTENSNVKNE